MIGVLLLLWLALFAAGNTPVGQILRRWLVDKPAAALARIERGAVIAWLILGTIGVACFLVLEEEGLRLFAMALPELAGWVVAFEITSLVDAIAMTLVVASSVRFGAVKAWIAARLPARRAKRARRSRVVRTETPAANDDEDGAAALAA